MGEETGAGYVGLDEWVAISGTTGEFLDWTQRCPPDEKRILALGVRRAGAPSDRVHRHTCYTVFEEPSFHRW